MKLRTAALTSFSLAGVALATTSAEPLEAYIIEPPSQPIAEAPKPEWMSTPPQIPRQLARHIIIRRLNAAPADEDASRSFMNDLAVENLAAHLALQYLAAFGGEPAGLFHSAGEADRSMVLMVEGVTADNARELRAGLKSTLGFDTPSFVVEDPPSAEANTLLIERDLHDSADGGSCSDGDGWKVLDLEEKHDDSRDRTCMREAGGIVKYDVAKQPEVLKALKHDLLLLKAAVPHYRMRVMLLLIPESSRTTGPSDWATIATPHDSNPDSRQQIMSELRRRARESVIEDDVAAPPPQEHKQQSSPNTHHAAAFSTYPRSIPACFSSHSACTNATDSCSGHGECVNKYGADSKNVCFVCQCQVIENADGRSRTFWAGRACQKKDVSTAFWLIAGLTIVLTGLVTFSIGLLFNVGEEKLPGVIGAGVSRPGK